MAIFGIHYHTTEEPLKTDTLSVKQKCPFHRGVRLIRGNFQEHSSLTLKSVRPKEVFALLDVRLKRVLCTLNLVVVHAFEYASYQGKNEYLLHTEDTKLIFCNSQIMQYDNAICNMNLKIFLNFLGKTLIYSKTGRLLKLI